MLHIHPLYADCTGSDLWSKGLPIRVKYGSDYVISHSTPYDNKSSLDGFNVSFIYDFNSVSYCCNLGKVIILSIIC